MGSSRNGLAVLGPSNFSQLRRHFEGSDRRLGLVRGKRLFFRLALGSNRGLECEARSVLTRYVLHGSVFVGGGLGRRCGSAFEREDHLSNFDLLAFLNLYFFHHAAHRRGNFDDGFVGFQFHHRLAFRHFRSRRNHQANQIALGDVFS